MLSLNVVLILLVLICTATDLITGKIYNCVTFPFLMAGMILRLIQSGVQSLPAVMISVLLPLLLLYPVWVLTGGSGLGGGDIKLLSAVSACLPAGQMLTVTLVSFASAAGFGIFQTLRRRRMLSAEKISALQTKEGEAGRDTVHANRIADMELLQTETEKAGSGTGIHLAFFIALGVLLHIGGVY